MHERIPEPFWFGGFFYFKRHFVFSLQKNLKKLKKFLKKY